MSAPATVVEKKVDAEKSIRDQLEQVRDKATESMKLGGQAGEALKTVVSLGTQSLEKGSAALKQLQEIIATLDPDSDLAKKLESIFNAARESNMWGKSAVALLTPVGANAENSLELGIAELNALQKVINSLPGDLSKPLVFSETALAARDAIVTPAVTSSTLVDAAAPKASSSGYAIT